MESARQELQGRREYMSNDKIKSWGSRSNGIEAAAHSLIIHGFTCLHLFSLGIQILPAYYQCSATQHGIMNSTKTMIVSLLTNVSQENSRQECNVKRTLRHDKRRDGPHQ